SFAVGKGKKLYLAYQDRLKVLNAVDFGDLLLECIRLFREHNEVLRQYQARFKYILVDEYQDTNVAQYLWLRLLGQSIPSASLPGLPRQSIASDEEDGSPGHAPSAQPSDDERSETQARARMLKNICCVGDDDQSIYGWRGAEVDNILRF